MLQIAYMHAIFADTTRINMAKYNELTRVQIPAIAHLCRLGYEYLSLKSAIWDPATNIFSDIFCQAISKLNPQLSPDDITRTQKDISLLLKNEDLGQAFYKKLTETSGVKLIDFEQPENNLFHVVLELTYGQKASEGESNKSFRPDITLLINGLPLVFLEVKKPNNQGGLKTEFERMQNRCQNHLFRPFINITQLMLFSNNQEYLPCDPDKTQGAFYATTGLKGVQFNYFRDNQETENERYETLNQSLRPFSEIEPDLNRLLTEFNAQNLKMQPEFATNCEPNTPTNRLCTALLSRDRLLFLLKYGLTYVNEEHGLEKHIMRYPQLFATKAIQQNLANGIRKGIIWHTQGSGKTALAYYNIKPLTDFYQKKNIIPKFYFIVDRLDLRDQAVKEFNNRGLIVNTINSRDDFIQEMKKSSALNNDKGGAEIIVVNIQKFQQSELGLQAKDYDINVQRIFFIDEAHRSFGNQIMQVSQFLANLISADPNAVHIGLTGTPLLGSGKNRVGSTAIFGNYIHKYYYNQSIADGYTLRLIREEIENSYKVQLSDILNQSQIKKGEVKSSAITCRPQFVEPMLDYIVSDFAKFRQRYDDKSLGAMVICDSAEQARMMHYIFNQKFAEKPQDLTAWRAMLSQNDPTLWGDNLSIAAEAKGNYNASPIKSASLILSDEGNSQYRKELVEDFKAGKTDILFVYNMLLTGFDAKRLKKLYLGRVIKEHNLLQALTRVNRSYKNYEFGFVVDFADIQSEFNKTNAAYQQELQLELGDEAEHYSQLFKTQEEIDADILHIKNTLFDFDTNNAERFRQQIDEINEKPQLLELKNTLELARSLYNQLRVDDKHGLEKLDFIQLNRLYRQVIERIDRLNDIERINSDDVSSLIEVALENIYFEFHKVREYELKLADSLQEQIRRTREALSSNIDQKDPEFVSLLDEIKRLMQKKNIQSVSQQEMSEHIDQFRKIEERATRLNSENSRLADKFNGDAKFVRIFKQAYAQFGLQKHKVTLLESLQDVKQNHDALILKQGQILISNPAFFERESLRHLTGLKTRYQLPLTPADIKGINELVVSEYQG